jgi:hypothetical protein
MAEDDAAQAAIAAAAAETSEEGLTRKVKVEVVHKQEGWGTAAWTAIGMFLIVAAVGSWFMLSGDGDGSGGDGLFGSAGNCGDGIDNDNDGRTDAQDGDCYDEVNPEFKGFNADHSEDGHNDPPGDDN